jgi:hypothetical protein
LKEEVRKETSMGTLLSHKRLYHSSERRRNELKEVKLYGRARIIKKWR